MPGQKAVHRGLDPELSMLKRSLTADGTWSGLADWEKDLLGQAGRNRLVKVEKLSREHFEVDREYGYTIRYVGGKPIDFKKNVETRTPPRTQRRRRDEDEDF
jgi:hypothetical protein